MNEKGKFESGWYERLERPYRDRNSLNVMMKTPKIFNKDIRYNLNH